MSARRPIAAVVLVSMLAWRGAVAQPFPIVPPPLPDRAAVPPAAPGAASATHGPAPARPCRAAATPDRQAVLLVDATDSRLHAHLPLGEHRAQQVVHAGDGRWAVVFTKLRGAAQFAVISIDLARCALQRTVELPQAADDVTFDGDEAVLRLTGGGERRIGLADRSVR